MNKKKFLISTHGFDMGIGGLKVLHKLCHLLNEIGEDAYLIPVNFNQPFGVYENYNVKMVTEDILNNLNDVVVIYPESWFGNYLNAPNVVRWMLAFPSEDHIVTWSEKDLWFWLFPYYITEKANKHSDNILFVDEQHRDIFYDRNLPRNGSCWTLRKAQDVIKPEQYVHPADSTFIPYHSAGNIAALSDLFNSKELFYCYDNCTYLFFQSTMCNTDTVVIPQGGSKENFINGHPMNKYVAYGIEDLPRAKSLRREFFDHLDFIEQNTKKQLYTFIDKCNEYFK